MPTLTCDLAPEHKHLGLDSAEGIQGGTVLRIGDDDLACAVSRVTRTPDGWLLPVVRGDHPKHHPAGTPVEVVVESGETRSPEGPG